MERRNGQPPDRGQMTSSRAANGTFSRPRRTVAPTVPANVPSASHSVRRNLFQSQLTRRPTHATAASSPKGGLAADGPHGSGLDGEGPGYLAFSPACDPPAAASGDIIVRNRNGEVEIVDLPSPTADEANESMPDERQEGERERQRLADTIKYHQQRKSIPGQPEELLDAIRASLRAKVSALAEDNWMYEPGDVPRPE